MIEIHQLTKSFRRRRVLDGVSLSFEAGERVALIGSNGAGKTTLIRCLLGEYTFDGQIRIHGNDPRRARREVLARIGFVPQTPPPLKMHVGQLVSFAAHLCGTDPSAIVDVAQRLGLDLAEVEDRPFVRLSGGMKQKLLIAIALGRQTSLLIMDEPSANLDPQARGIFFELLAERASNATMLISSHRINEVAMLVNRMVEMDMGRVVLDDRVADDVALAQRLLCHIEAKREEPALAKSLAAWNFVPVAPGLAWEGTIAGPDRLRFLGMASRYVGVISQLSWKETAQ
jgi:ABC-2 type transport system ATP-binding protein